MSTFELIQGDCLESLKKLPSESVHCCVTSPPYWGLRDYGTAKWEGGNVECDHSMFLGGNGEASQKQVTSGGTQKYQYRDVCAKCGARRTDQQFGLERTPEEYVAKTVEIFREVRRVLRDDGTLWLNLGDSYAHSLRQSGTAFAGDKQNTNGGSIRSGFKPCPDGLKEKDLVGIPWMVAFALRADGWYLRLDIIWAKGTSGERREGNVMPESVRDRCTKAHEYLFLLSKSGQYYFDNEAIKEPAQDWGTRDRSNWRGGTNDPKLKHHGFEKCNHEKANRRSVWRVNPKPYKGAHFATYPEKLVEPCILAGTSEKGCCPKCGSQWERVIERKSDWPERKAAGEALRHGLEGAAFHKSGGYESRAETVGWKPSCECAEAPVPCTVLDPFNGAGTTGVVALKHGRRYLGLELNPEYVEMSRKRILESLGKEYTPVQQPLPEPDNWLSEIEA